MHYSTRLALALSTLPAAATHHAVQGVLQRQLDRLAADLLAFQLQPCSPTAAFDLERRVAEHLRDIGRELTQWLYNRLEGDHPDALPTHLRIAGEDYRLVRHKTRRAVDTLFGPVALHRHLYRPASDRSAEASVAPLERMLGVAAGVTPALAEVAARHAAAAGATQRVVQDHLRAQHGVTLGVERLRALLAHVSGNVAEARQQFQVARVLDLLAQADASTGRTKPVLAVSRDGISLKEHQHSLYEMASTGTVSVFDRRGNRLGTVYVALAPELGQQQMTDQLTGLIEAVLQGWTGPLPRLAYVTDAGDHETNYYCDVLRPMVHPRTGERLAWQRVIDFYHAMERVWKLSDALFGRDGRDGHCWAQKMRALLKTPNGPFRVLHSAAALRQRRTLGRDAAAEYAKAYNYLRTRTAWMQYAEYQRVNVPMGSGIVEAACKTIFTQRLKLSGMRWSKEGAQVILNLRVVLLSGVWEAAYRQTLTTGRDMELRTPGRDAEIPLQMAS